MALRPGDEEEKNLVRAPSEKREVEADANVIRGEVLLAGVQLCRVRVGEDNWFVEANACFKDHVEEQLRRREIVSARFSQFWTLMSFRWSLVKVISASQR